jgi:hypothetical protein
VDFYTKIFDGKTVQESFDFARLQFDELNKKRFKSLLKFKYILEGNKTKARTTILIEKLEVGVQRNMF